MEPTFALQQINSTNTNNGSGGIPVSLTTCKDSGNDSQKWLYADNQYLRLKANPALCLDLYAANTNIYTPIKLYWCSGLDAVNQKWSFNCPQTKSIDAVTVYTSENYSDCGYSFPVGDYVSSTLTSYCSTRLSLLLLNINSVSIDIANGRWWIPHGYSSNRRSF